MTRDREPWDDADVASLFSQANGVIARCPAPELLSPSRAGTLPPDLQTAVSAHVEACVVCRMLADALEDETVAVLQPDESKRILDRLRPQIAPTRSWRWTVAERALASAAVLLVAIAAWRIVQPPSPEAPTNPAPATRVAVLDIASAPILPSDAQGPLASNRRPEERVALLEGLIPYRQGDYDRAATQFAAMVARDPQSAAGHFYLGLSELMRGRHARAIEALSVASRLERPETDDAPEILWHLAVAHYRAGAIDVASGRLNALCSGRTIRAAPACMALQALSGPLTLKATVTDTSGTPLRDVIVGEHRAAPARTTPTAGVAAFTSFAGRTDATGVVEISGEPRATTARMIVRAVKPGYFTSSAVVPIGSAMQHDFKMSPVVAIGDDQTIRETTRFDPVCESSDEPCQRYAVTATRTGRLEVAVTTANREAMDVWVELPNGDMYSPRIKAPLLVEVNAFAGTTYQIRVLSLRGVPRNFELNIQVK